MKMRALDLPVVIQASLLPKAPGGAEGPWLIPPDQSGRVVGCIAIAGILTLLLTLPFHKRWKANSLAAGYWRFDDIPHFYPPLHPCGPAVDPLIAAAMLSRYFCSWRLISTDGIQVRMPHAQTDYRFEHITALGLKPLPIPTEIDRYKYYIHFADGRDWGYTLSIGSSRKSISWPLI